MSVLKLRDVAAPAALLVAFAAASSGCSVPAPRIEPAEQVRTQVLSGLAALDTALLRLHDVAKRSRQIGGDTKLDVQRECSRARDAYKRVEFIVAAMMPTVARALNGPPIDEMEEEEGDRPIRHPEGLQVIEALLPFSQQSDSLARIASVAAIARSSVSRAVQVTRAASLSDTAIFDFARRELAIVAILGFGRFDTVDEARSLRESAHAIAGVRTALAAYANDGARREPEAWQTLAGRLQALESAIDTAAAQRERAQLVDRLALLTEHLRPTALALRDVRVALKIGTPPGDDGWRASAATPYEIDAMDMSAYAHASAIPSSDARAELGRRLFFDTRLSRDETRSCDGCHLPERAFTDGLAVARVRTNGQTAVARLSIPARNTPTLINSGLQPVQFADGRVAFMEDQIASVVHNRAEMDGDLSLAARRFMASPRDRVAFAKAFGEAADSTVTPRRIQAAITSYLRALTRLNAPFDRFVRGDHSAMSAEAQRGFDVFMGKGRCGTCHFAPTFSGAVPLRFIKAEYEVLGVPDASGRHVDTDIGRELVAGNTLHRFAFRTPSLRNVALTAPYMHNGVFRTLEDVMAFYDHGGGRGHGLQVPTQTLPADSLHLSMTERRMLIAFLGALTDTVGTTQRPDRRALP